MEKIIISTKQALPNEIKTGFYAQLFIVALICTLYTREMFNANLFYPDSSHLMLDGFLIADYLRDTVNNGFNNPMDYAIRYFGQYPALSIGYKPPLWPAIQSVFILIFGEESWAMRLALLGLAIFVGIAIFRTVERGSGVFLAWAAASLAISIPYLVQWGWYAMTELSAVAFVLSAGWPFCRYLEDGRQRNLAYMVILLAAGVWCKQTAAVGALWLFIATLLSLGPKETFRRREVWLAMAGYAVLIMPVIWLTIEFGKKNIAQSIGFDSASTSIFVAPISNILKYIRLLFGEQLTHLFFALAIGGILVAAYRLYQGVSQGEGRNIILYFSLIVATYLFFTLINGENPRYTVFWLPAFGFFVAYLINELRRFLPTFIAAGAVLALLALNVMQAFAMGPSQTTGMAQAAQYIASNINYPIIMIDSYVNEQFIYFMRKMDPQRKFWTIRSDKVLSMAPMSPTSRNVVELAKSEGDIKNILLKYGIKYLVVDRHYQMKIPIHNTLRKYVSSGDFRLLYEIPVTSQNTYRYKVNKPIQIYEFLKWQPAKSNTITIQVPIVGKSFTVPLDAKWQKN
ncbi:MAG: glycosyltransferase family 39 protein [Magnetococcales bacterium]|nr:glycosyltransferase family 39 protein [Magnetococcales bacterium]